MTTENHGGEGVKGKFLRMIGAVNRFLCQILWPGARRCVGAVYSVTRHRVAPAVGSGSSRIRGELVKIHRQENWFKRSTSTLGGNAAGLGMAMLSTKVVEAMVEKREFSNLWGVLADRPVVSETTFEVLSFIVEFLLALIVFTITEYYISEYQRRRAEASGEAATDEEGGPAGEA